MKEAKYISADNLILTVTGVGFYYTEIANTLNFSRKIRFYELDLITEGEAILTINGVKRRFLPGEICFRHPGDTSTLDEYCTYKCYNLYFVLYERTSNKKITSAYGTTFFDKIPTHLKPSDPSGLIEILSGIYGLRHKNEELERVTSRVLEAQFIKTLYSIVNEEKSSNKGVHPGVNRAIDYISNNINSKISIAEMAKYAHVSEKHLFKLFKQYLGETPVEFILKYRLKICKTKLLTTDMNVAEIALDTGYESSSYFCRVFKKFYGVTPNQMRRSIKADFPNSKPNE